MVLMTVSPWILVWKDGINSRPPEADCSDGARAATHDGYESAVQSGWRSGMRPSTGHILTLSTLQQDLFPDRGFIKQRVFAAQLWLTADQRTKLGMADAQNIDLRAGWGAK